METEFLQRRVELLHSENQCNREDIARLTTELARKVRGHSTHDNRISKQTKNPCNREDIARLTTELARKVRIPVTERT